MSIDYKIYPKKERGFYPLRDEPRYFQVGPINPFFPKEDEKSSKEKAEQEQTKKEEQAKPKDQTQKTQQQAQTKTETQLLKTSLLERRAGETREEKKERIKEEKAKLDLERKSTGQTAEEIVEKSRYDTRDVRTRLETSSRNPSFLQTIRSLTTGNENLGEKVFLAKESLPNFIKDPSKIMDPTGRRSGDLRRFIGESGRIIHEQWSERSAKTFSHDKPFAGLGGNELSNPLQNSDPLNHLINQLTGHLPETHPALAEKASQIAAIFYSKNLLLVRDGENLRLFRLMEDGTLWESTQEHRGKPLSTEARRALSDALKQRGLQARLQGEKEILGGKKKTEGGRDPSLTARGELKTLNKDESSFAHLLRAVLEEKKEIGESLSEGGSPEFISKKDWAAFFSRMLNLGSAEETSSKTFDEIMSFIFRGLFKKQSGDTLVSDIKYQLEGKLREDKFAQIDIVDEELLDLLRNLKPGESISKEMLQDFLGNEISFIKLIHLISKADPGYASEILKNVKFNPAANVDPYSQARLEHHIFSQSRKKEPGEITGVFADPFKLQDKPKWKFFGKPRLYTLIAYLAAGFAILLLLLYFLRVV